MQHELAFLNPLGFNELYKTMLCLKTRRRRHSNILSPWKIRLSGYVFPENEEKKLVLMRARRSNNVYSWQWPMVAWKCQSPFSQIIYLIIIGFIAEKEKKPRPKV